MLLYGSGVQRETGIGKKNLAPITATKTRSFKASYNKRLWSFLVFPKYGPRRLSKTKMNVWQPGHKNQQ